MSNINILICKLNDIMRKSWIKVNDKSSGGIGLQIESLLGINSNNLEYPDFNGIELKTKTNTKIQFLTLFNATPDNNLFEIKRIQEKFGYPSKDNRNYKFFNVSVYNNKKIKLVKYGFQLFVDDLNQKIVLLVFDRFGALIESKISWSFNMLENKFKRKFNHLCVINISTKRINDSSYFSINSFHIYNIKKFEDFIGLIKEDKIRVTFKIGVFSSGKRVGEIHDRGTGFDLNIEFINELFTKII